MKKFFYFSFLCLASCSDNNLPVYVKLESLRVLALIASSPEVSAAGTFTITPVVSDVNGAGRSLTYSAEACVDPGIAFGAEPSCVGNSTRTILATNAAVTGLSSPDYTGVVNSIGGGTITAPSALIAFAGRTTAEQFNGINYLITYEVQAADGTKVQAYKRVVISTKPIKNSNPSFTEILADGAALSTLPAGSVQLASSYPDASRESYLYQQSDGSQVTQTETHITTWFYTDGEVKFYRTSNTDTTTYTPPGARPSGRNVVIIGVLRDERGGAVIKQKTL